MENKNQKGMTALHGYTYQLRLLMLFLCRGISKEYSFRLGTEIKEAMKFDDLVFAYSEGDKTLYRLLQAKHKLDDSKKITKELLTEDKGDFNLQKYLRSYQASKKQKLFKTGKIKDIIICTNIGFNFDDLQKAQIEVQKIVGKDDFLDIEYGEKQSERYTFKFNKAIAKILNQQSIYSDKDIKDFLNHLVFVINLHNGNSLRESIQKEIGKEFNRITTEDAYDKLFQIMLTWFEDKNSSRFLSHEDGKEFFNKIKIGIPIWFNMKNPVTSFTGRTRELDELYDLLHGPDSAGTSPLVFITGLGGVGKTELVRRYISQYAANYDNKVIWINAESYQRLAESFRKLSSDILDISTKNANNEEMEMSSIVENVYMFFSRGESLFVFDNAEKYKSQNNYDPGIDKFLPSVPPTYNRPYVLITSRNQKWPENIKVLQLNVLSQEEAMEFIRMSLDLKNNAQEEDIRKLAGQLHFLPLALQQAVAYITDSDKKMRHVGSQFSIEEYLKKYNEKTKEVLNFEFPEDSDNDYTRTAFTTWNITLDMIKDKGHDYDASTILYIISYLAPEGIPTDMFSKLISDKEKLASAIELLAQYSMVNSEHKILNVHRVVQQVIRMHLKEQNREQEILLKTLQLFRGNITSININHAISVWNYSKTYNELVNEFMTLSKDISVALINSARFEEAYLFGKDILGVIGRLSSEYNVQLVSSSTQNNIGLALLGLGKYDIALQTFKDALMCFKSVILEINIYNVLFAQCKYDEALKNAEAVLTVLEKKSDVDVSQIRSVQHDIAKILDSKGEHDEALRILNGICKDQIDKLGSNNSETLATNVSIAQVLFHQGKRDEGLEMLQKIYKESLTKNDPTIVNVQKNIAGMHLAQGKFSDALEAYQNVLNNEKHILGEDHPDVLYTRCHIAEILREQRKYDEALEICREVFEKQTKILAPDHLNIISTQLTTARILKEQKNYSDALTIFQGVLGSKKIILGDEHPDTITVRNEIAVIYLEQEKFDEAIQQHKEILRIQKHNFDENHFDTLITKKNLGFIFIMKKNFAEGCRILQEVSIGLEKYPNDPRTSKVKDDMRTILITLINSPQKGA